MHVGPVEPARLLFCVRSSVPRRPIKGPKVGEGPPFIHLEQASGLTDQQCCGTFVTPRESSTTMRAGCWEAAHLTRLRSVPAGPRGLRTRNVFSATLHPASAGPRHPDQELARTAARTARLSVQLPRLLRPGRRHHAFHTGARRWNRGHNSDLAKSTNSNRKGLEGRHSLGSKIPSYIHQLCTEKMFARPRRIPDQSDDVTLPRRAPAGPGYEKGARRSTHGQEMAMRRRRMALDTATCAHIIRKPRQPHRA